MDDHARRVLAPVLDDLDKVQAGEATVADLQASVVGATGALDNAYAAIRLALERLDADLETISFTVNEEDQRDAVKAKASDLRRLVTEA